MCAQQIREQKEEVRKKLRERAVPSSAITRAAGFAGMGASLVFGSMKDSVRALPSFLLCLHMCGFAQAPLAVPAWVQVLSLVSCMVSAHRSCL